MGVERAGVVYELFLTNLPQSAFTAADVVALYLHRGAFENALADEDAEQDPDRWCSYADSGRVAWQILTQWVWNLRLELGHQLEPTPLRITEFAPGVASASAEQASSSGYGPPTAALLWKRDRLAGRDFVPQPDGTLHCPAGQTLRPTEQRKERDGTLRVLYSARIRDCRPCPLREFCQRQGKATKKPRRVSLLWHPLGVGSAPVLWKDWSRRQHRRACMHLLYRQRVEVQLEQALQPSPATKPPPFSRAERAHYRLSWAERLARNVRTPTAGRVTIRLFGVPASFATWLSLATA